MSEPEIQTTKKKNTSTPKKGRTIGGWLWAIAAMLIASLLASVVRVIYVGAEWFQNDGQSYYSGEADKLFWIRNSTYLFMFLTAMGAIVWAFFALRYFFQKKKKFVALFLGFIGYILVTEAISVVLLHHYAVLAEHDPTGIDGNLTRTCVIGALCGLYLTKSKRPIQTFIN